MRRPDETQPATVPADEAWSKTRRKAEMAALRALGEALVRFDPARLPGLGLPEQLTEAIVAARRITKHGARRRQLHYIGKLMREVDPAAIEALKPLLRDRR